MIAAAHGPSTLWYATRGTGAIALVLLTLAVVLGIGEVRAWRPAGAPRFAIAAMHRTVSLLAVALLAVHIVTTLLDPFPRIGVLNALVPFQTDYRPLWMGLGTVAAGLLAALVVTSLVRRRLGYRVWRGVHWFAYTCWPVALLHGIGAGSDTRTTWMLALTLACVGAVLVTVAARLAAPGTPREVRIGAGVAGALATLALGIWLPQGPLARGWARRAGTPAQVLAAFAPRARAAVKAAPPADALARPFSATLAGRVNNGTSAGGLGVADLRMRLQGGPPGVLRLRLGGQALPGGGLRMERSAVTLGPPGDPARYSGRIESLRNNVLSALVGSSDGRAVRLTVELALQGVSVAGQVRATPVGA
ncbi:MAG: ferric reductase-like transmembrane domain-containing protein [Solirubrobacteraceae bacterium]